LTIATGESIVSNNIRLVRFASWLLTVCFGTAFTAGIAHGQQWSLSRFSSDPKTVYSAAAAVTPPPGTGVIVLDNEVTYVFDAQGNATYTDYIVYKVLTADGANGWGSVTRSWEPWHQQQPAIRARVITPDGTVHMLDASTITNSPAKDDQDNVYGDRRVIRAPLPAIGAGSVVEEEDTCHEDPVFSGTGSVRLMYFGNDVPVQHTRLTLDAPASLPIRYHVALLPDMTPSRSEANGRVQITFDYGPEPGLETADSDLPSNVAPYPEVIFSTGESWHHLAEAYAKTIDSRIASSDLSALVSKLVEGNHTQNEKLLSVLQYLSKGIRYTGVEFADAAVVPVSPSQVITRGFGDCKDKATLFVAMLRAVGIPSYVALLSVGERQDISADLPGMGLFDHAIVYVPGTPDLWIDTTDRYARLGELPAADQGRYALVIRPETDALVRTPVSSSRDNLSVEDRQFDLAEYGPARVTEISYPHGERESTYRDDFADVQNKDARKNLTDYVKNIYLADSLDEVDRSDPDDLSKPFELTLRCNHAKRGFTDLDSAVAAIRLDGLFSDLPSDLQNRDTNDKGQATSADEKEKSRTADYQLDEAFATEWDYKIVPPAGFEPKPLPNNVKLPLGSALLTEQFSAEEGGIVRAVIRFDTVKRQFSVAEATEMRNRIADVKNGAPILLYFQPVADRLISQEQARQGIQIYRDLIAAHPNDPVYHLRKAEALLAGGLGNAARDEARMAVKLDPKSAVAEKTLADILECDSVGRRFRPGSDYAGAEAAFRAAEKLDPNDKAVVGNLAILLEFNPIGLHYGPGAKLDEAITEYRRLSDQDLADLGLANNLAFALFYDGKFADALKQAEALNPQPTSLLAACAAGLNGSQAGIAVLKSHTDTPDSFSTVARSTGDLLANIGTYSLAADFYEAGASGDNAAGWTATAATFRRMQPHDKIAFPNTPTGAALHFYFFTIDPNLTLDQLRSILSRNGLAALATPETTKNYVTKEKAIIEQKAISGEFADIGIDTALANAEPVASGDDHVGYRVTLFPSRQDKTVIYVVKEDGRYKVVSHSREEYGLGLEILDRVAANDLTGARKLLDWVREDWSVDIGDDPVSGPAFPRLWTKGENADAETIKNAAAAILVLDKDTASRGLAILESAEKSSTARTDMQRDGVLISLISGYDNLQMYDKALRVGDELARLYPDSTLLFLWRSFDLRMLGRFKEAEVLAQQRLAKTPSDMDAQKALMTAATMQDNHALAYELGSKIIHLDKAQPGDFNDLAWESLFVGKTDQQSLSYAIKAAQLSNYFSELHTLGCIYAELGKTKEARDVLIEAMDKANMDDLDPNTWYAFGRIAEQYGERDLAMADYKQIEKPKPDIAIPDSAYELAQLRLSNEDV
jgi:tetratricopeptide (TPR) repeat protein/transglutaminase-like putative cysteine protease